MRPRTARHLSVLASLIAVAMTLPVGPPHARADRLTYDPTRCAIDPEDTVSIALGRTVLRIPMDVLTYISALPPEERGDAPSPPDPSEPQGCPGHPIQGFHFALAYGHTAEPASSQDPARLPAVLERVWIVAVRSGLTGSQSSAEDRFQQRCESYGIRDVLPNGLMRCYRPPADRTTPREDWTVQYQAPPHVYAAPFGRPFVVDCWTPWRGVRQCDVNYRLFAAVNLTYRFNGRRIAIADIIDIDRALRARLEAARATDFEWADEARGGQQRSLIDVE